MPISHPLDVNSTKQPVIQTTDSVHQQTAAQVSANLQDALGTPHQVIPTTADSEPEGDSLEQFKDRAILGRPGIEPSKSWLKKLVDRVKKKQPDSDVAMKQ